MRTGQLLLQRLVIGAEKTYRGLLSGRETYQTRANRDDRPYFAIVNGWVTLQQPTNEVRRRRGELFIADRLVPRSRPDVLITSVRREGSRHFKIVCFRELASNEWIEMPKDERLAFIHDDLRHQMALMDLAA